MYTTSPTARSPWRRALLFTALAAALSSCGPRPPREEARAPEEPPPPNVPVREVDTWKAAALKVEEDRGEPMGRQAKLDVPAELRHYANRHRFLAIQVAESREQDVPTPRDYAELVQLIDQGGLVEMKPVGDDYVLYGVGDSATAAPFTAHDAKRGIDVPLLAGYDEFEEEYNKLAASIEPISSQVEAWKAERLRVPATQKRRRAILLSRIRAGERKIKEAHDEQEVLAFYYQDHERRRTLVMKYQALAGLAGKLEGKQYDLRDPEDRRQLKARLLSFIRPEARDVILEIAREYKRKFDRPLPVTSLVRTEEYQARLGRAGNPNATKISTAPHTTGLAFDILYKFMTAGEQDALMRHIARLEDEGRVEALRENLNHIHVFAFADGQRPHESLIQASLKQVDAELPVVKPAPRKAKAKASVRSRRSSRTSKASLKSPSRKPPTRTRRAATRS